MQKPKRDGCPERGAVRNVVDMTGYKDKNWYYIGFVGTNNFVYVGAYSVKEAKQKFADHFGVQVSGYIGAKKTNMKHLVEYTGLKIK
jgi:hypothetical protein